MVTGFIFSFVFHWGTVEPASPAMTDRKELKQGKRQSVCQLSVSVFFFFFFFWGGGMFLEEKLQ